VSGRLAVCAMALMHEVFSLPSYCLSRFHPALAGRRVDYCAAARIMVGPGRRRRGKRFALLTSSAALAGRATQRSAAPYLLRGLVSWASHPWAGIGQEQLASRRVGSLPFEDIKLCPPRHGHLLQARGQPSNWIGCIWAPVCRFASAVQPPRPWPEWWPSWFAGNSVRMIHRAGQC
jgi:hypothetical protein